MDVGNDKLPRQFGETILVEAERRRLEEPIQGMKLDHYYPELGKQIIRAVHDDFKLMPFDIHLKQQISRIIFEVFIFP